MSWSPQQEEALRAVRHWYCTGGRPVFYLAGFAGTGKTTLAKEIAGSIHGSVVFAAFTGKAALVLRRKGCHAAQTLHSLIYKLEREDETGGLFWTVNRESAARDARLIIVDECSMVDAELANDLLSFRTKVLVLGDPAQLPPVKGEGFFTSREPDFLLTEIHRQARDNPIIHLSMIVREGGRLTPGRFGDSVVIAASDRNSLLEERVIASDQILVGTNRRRIRSNAVYRQVKGIDTDIPVEGEKLVCLKNNRAKRLLNGGLWKVDEVEHYDERGVKMTVSSEDDDTSALIRTPYEFFVGREDELSWPDKKHADQFTYGYALTVHKSQGSQWDDVVIFDESPVFREDRAKHLYTALTRAAVKVVVQL